MHSISAAPSVGWRWAYVIGAVLALAALLVTPQDTAGRERTVPAPGERATAALSVIGIVGIRFLPETLHRGVDATELQD